MTGLLYNRFLFLLRLPKYDWLFIYSVTRVKQNVAERKRREVQAIPAGMQRGNAIFLSFVSSVIASNKPVEKKTVRLLLYYDMLFLLYFEKKSLT